jgi:hypothetical protein
MDVACYLSAIYEDSLNMLETSAIVLDFTENFIPHKKKIHRVEVRSTSLQVLKSDLAPSPLEEISNCIPEDDNCTIESKSRVQTVELFDRVEIPDNLTITPEEMSMRRYFDQRRWHCLSRPQYKASCGISSLVSCWNYLYSTLGHGTLPPMSQEKALTLLGFEPPFYNIKFGSFTGNKTLIKWFKNLNRQMNVSGDARIFWKLHGDDKTLGISSENALNHLISGLRGTSQAFIYHCHNHYFCPMGFELNPMCPPDTYKPLSDIRETEIVPWIIIGEPSKAYPCFHVRKWSDIVTDIDCQNPRYFNIRHPERGVQEMKKMKKSSRAGGNLHCLIVFERTNNKI